MMDDDADDNLIEESSIRPSLIMSLASPSLDSFFFFHAFRSRDRALASILPLTIFQNQGFEALSGRLPSEAPINHKDLVNCYYGSVRH